MTAVRSKISNDHELYHCGADKILQQPASTGTATINNYLTAPQSYDFDCDESSISSLSDISSTTNSRWYRRHNRRTCLYCCRKETTKESSIGGGTTAADGPHAESYASRRRRKISTSSTTSAGGGGGGGSGRLNPFENPSFTSLWSPESVISSDDATTTTTIATGGGIAADKVAASILRHVQRMANPVWSKQSKMALLELKQKNPSAFQDICLYSEICLALSRNTYQLYARRFLQELFLDLDFECLNVEAQSVAAAALAAAGYNLADMIDGGGGRLTQPQNGRQWADLNGDMMKSSANAAQLASVFETSAENLDNESRGLIVVIELQKLQPTTEMVKSPTTNTSDYKSPITAMPPPVQQSSSAAITSSSSLTTRRLPSELLPTDNWQYDVDANSFRHGEFVYAGCEYTAWGDQLSRRVPLTGWIYDVEKLQFRKATVTSSTPTAAEDDAATATNVTSARRCWRPISSTSSNTSSIGGGGGGVYTKGSSFNGGAASDDAMTGVGGGTGQDRRMRPRFNTLELDLSCTKNRFPIGERRRTIEQLIHNGGPTDVRAKLPRDDWTYVAKCDVFVHKNVLNN